MYSDHDALTRISLQTIQDAILLCRGLSIPWLWVDSLCIIQKDHNNLDWTEETAKMKEIYSNSHLTIAAEDSPGSDVGFDQLFRKRLKRHRWREGEQLQIWINDIQSKTQVKEVLPTRAWALQERILSNESSASVLSKWSGSVISARDRNCNHPPPICFHSRSAPSGSVENGQSTRVSGGRGHNGITGSARIPPTLRTSLCPVQGGPLLRVLNCTETVK